MATGSHGTCCRYSWSHFGSPTRRIELLSADVGAASQLPMNIRRPKVATADCALYGNVHAGNEATWAIVDSVGGTVCEGGNYDDHGLYDESDNCCFQLPGSYSLMCYDVFGDGWTGGVLSVNGVEFCHQFEGTVANAEIIINPTDVSDLCSPCDPGFHDGDSNGDSACTMCEAGTWSGAAGTSGDCTPCPTNQTTSQPGSSSAAACVPIITGQCRYVRSATCTVPPLNPMRSTVATAMQPQTSTAPSDTAPYLPTPQLFSLRQAGTSSQP